MTLLFNGKPLTGLETIEDSIYVPDFLKQIGFDHSEVLKEIEQKTQYVPRSAKEMLYRGHQLARDKFFLIKSQVNAEGQPEVLYKYRYPGFQYASLLHHKSVETVPAIAKIMSVIEESLMYNSESIRSNAVIGTRYHQPSDHIGYHSDKTYDLVENSPILGLTFGDVRELHLAYGDSSQPAKIFVTEPGSLFLLGPETNKKMKHSIVKVSEEKVIKRTQPAQPRVSLVMRAIKTELSLQQVKKKIKVPALVNKTATPNLVPKIPLQLRPSTQATKIPLKLKQTEDA